MAIDTPENKSFIERYRAFVKDPKAVTHHAMCSAYFQVFLWKQAVEKAKDTSPNAVREAVRDQSFLSPGGEVKVAAENLHTWLTPRIAQWGGRRPGQDRRPPTRTRSTRCPTWAYGEDRAETRSARRRGLDVKKLKG